VVIVAAAIQNVAGTGYLYAKDPDGNWYPIQAVGV